MRLLPALILSLLLGCGVARAADVPPEAARQVVGAYEGGDVERLTALARNDDPDPWLVADVLCRQGKIDAAMAFARAAQRQDTSRLPAYIEIRREHPHDADVRAALEVAGKAKAGRAGRRSDSRLGKVDDADEARVKAEAAAALARLDEQARRGDGLERALVEFERAGTLEALGRHEESAEAFLGAGRLAEDLGWFAKAAACYLQAGHRAYQVSDYDVVLYAWNRLVTVEEGRGDRGALAKAIMLAGCAVGELGDYDRAIQRLEDARSTYAEIGSEDGQAWVLDNLAVMYMRNGDTRRLRAALEEALALARKAGNRYRVASVLGALGAYYSRVSSFDKALELHRQALALCREIGDPEGVAQGLGNLGQVYTSLGEHEKAIEYLQQSLEAFRALEDGEPWMPAVFINLGSAYLAAGDLDRAQELLEDATRRARDAGAPWDETHALQSYAEVLLAQGAFAEAKKQIDMAQDIARRTASPSLLTSGYRILAQVHLAEGDYARAFNVAQRGVESSLSVFAGLGHGQAAVARNALSPLYEASIRAAAAWERAGPLFTALEQSRSGALLESLENRSEIRDAAVPAALRLLESGARRRANEASVRYQKALRGGDLREVRARRAELRDARSALHAVIGQIQAQAKVAARVLYPVPITLDEWQRTLAPADAYVCYSLFGEEAIALLVRKTETRIIRLGPVKAIEDAARQPLGNPGRDPTETIARLRKLLVEPLGLKATATRVLVSPHAILGYVPFALLVGDRDLAYVPSATAYLSLEAGDRPGGTGVLALGDPDYAPSGPAEKAPVRRGGIRLVPLPATRAEAEAVGDVVLLGKDATPGRFLLTVATRSHWRAVHLACHGLVDPERPMQSALALAFPREGSNLLTCGEVFQKRIPADLAVLSACETGKGAVYRVEGIVGMTQAFMMAGSPRVLVSLWKVDDAATRALMTKFYALWNPEKGKGLSAVAALRQAQAHVRAQKQWAHPYYWAAWVLWGLND
jgi:tetratricopeptide (TPR) repeat protein